MDGGTALAILVPVCIFVYVLYSYLTYKEK